MKLIVRPLEVTPKLEEITTQLADIAEVELGELAVFRSLPTAEQVKKARRRHTDDTKVQELSPQEWALQAVEALDNRVLDRGAQGPLTGEIRMEYFLRSLEGQSRFLDYPEEIYVTSEHLGTSVLTLCRRGINVITYSGPARTAAGELVVGKVVERESKESVRAHVKAHEDSYRGIMWLLRPWQRLRIRRNLAGS